MDKTIYDLAKNNINQSFNHEIDGITLNITVIPPVYIYPVINCPTPAPRSMILCIKVSSLSAIEKLSPIIGEQDKNINVSTYECYIPKYFVNENELDQFLIKDKEYIDKYGKSRWTFPFTALIWIDKILSKIRRNQ